MDYYCFKIKKEIDLPDCDSCKHNGYGGDNKEVNIKLCQNRNLTPASLVYKEE